MPQWERTQSKVICYCLHKRQSILHYCSILFFNVPALPLSPMFLSTDKKGLLKKLLAIQCTWQHGIWHTNGSIVGRPKATEEWTIADLNWIVLLPNEKESSVIYSLLLGGGKQTTKPKNYYICFFNQLQNKKEKWLVWYWLYNVRLNNSLEFLEP